MKKSSTLVLLALFFSLSSCSESNRSVEGNGSKAINSSASNAEQLFRLLPAEQTGLDFNNEYHSDNVFNIFTYEYAYNGGGVAVGDINNDGLADVYFTGNLVMDKLFLNKGNMQFEDISQSSGITSEGYSSGVSMADVNGDGLLDIYVCRTSKFPDPFRRNLLFINNGDLTFQERGEEYKLASIAFSSQAYFFDYDQDDDLDMYLVNHRFDLSQAQKVNLEQDPVTKNLRLIEPETHPLVTDRLFRNENGAYFTDVTTQAGLENHSFGLSAAILDVNEDGWPDIYVANDFVGGDNMYINQKNGVFVDELSTRFGHIPRNSMGTDAADINNDGYLDLLVLDMLPADNHRLKMLKGSDPYDKFHTIARGGGHHQTMKNALQLNRGDGTFQEIGSLLGMSHTDWSWAPLVADFDNDGEKDIFISNGIRKDVTDLDMLTYNVQDLITVAGGKDNLDPVVLESRYPEKRVGNYLFRNNGDLNYQDISKAWGITQPSFSNGSAYADFDNDGDLDLIVNNIDQEAFLYENKASQLLDNAYLTVQLKGRNGNTFGIGAEVRLYLDDGSMQMSVQSPTRGYLSSVAPQLHFGLGKKEIDRLEVVWPDGASQVIQGVAVNHSIVLDQADAQQQKVEKPTTTALFQERSAKYNIDFTHQENDFVDYKRDPLLPNSLSREGPFIAVADVNGDKLEDFYIGNAMGAAGELYIQTASSTFLKKANPAFVDDARYEDTGVLFFDADSDGDQDLYVASGGSAYEGTSDKYQDRFYLNDGKGNFSKQYLPTITSSSACVVALDIENDGDLDLFVGGRHLPGAYPLSPTSYLLINENGQFVDKTSECLPKSGQLGMITNAVVANIDQDAVNELVIVGDWMPVTILKPKGGRLVIDKEIPNSNGLWNTVAAADFDQDGDVDLLIGNQGLNSFYTASNTEPAMIYAKDFDNNGKIDPIICHYIQGVSYPKASRDELIAQIPQLKNKLQRYTDYADATIEELFSLQNLSDATQLKCQTTASSMFENDGKGQYTVKVLPLFAQFAPLNGLLVHDFNMDGKPDFIAAGNDLYPPVAEGRLDALSIQYYENDTRGGFNTQRLFAEKALLGNDYRMLTGIKLANGIFIVLAANNDGKMQVFEYVGAPVN